MNVSSSILYIIEVCIVSAIELLTQPVQKQTSSQAVARIADRTASQQTIQ